MNQHHYSTSFSGNQNTQQQDRYARRNAISGPSPRAQQDGNSTPADSPPEDSPARCVAQALQAMGNHQLLSQREAVRRRGLLDQPSSWHSTLPFRPRPLIVQKVGQSWPFAENQGNAIGLPSTEVKEPQDNQPAVAQDGDEEGRTEDDEVEEIDHDEDDAEAHRHEGAVEGSDYEEEESESDGEVEAEEDGVDFF